MGADDRRSRSNDGWAHVSLPARMIFYAGVFCLFAPFAILFDLAGPNGLPWTTMAVWSAYSGATAVGWAYAFATARWSRSTTRESRRAVLRTAGR